MTGLLKCKLREIHAQIVLGTISNYRVTTKRARVLKNAQLAYFWDVQPIEFFNERLLEEPVYSVRTWVRGDLRLSTPVVGAFLAACVTPKI